MIQFDLVFVDILAGNTLSSIAFCLRKRFVSSVYYTREWIFPGIYNGVFTSTARVLYTPFLSRLIMYADAFLAPRAATNFFLMREMLE